MKKQLLLFFLLLLPLVASADDSGSCGSNVNYTYVEATHTLTISGSGPMKDYYDTNTPWYNYRQYIKSVFILNGVTSIGNYAFSGCSGLTSVTIPNSVTSIGSQAFAFCRGLTSVTIPNSVMSIGDWAFRNCSGLTSVTIPNSVTSIGDYAFRGCSGLTSVTIPNSVTSIGQLAFSGCSGLTSVTIPNSVTSIGDDAFRECSGLTSVTIGNSVTSIGNSAFWGCSGLTSVTIPNSVTSIGSQAFAFCRGLTSVTIPNSVTEIGEEAFSGCSYLATLTLPEDIKVIKKGTFKNCAIKSIVIPAKVEFIYAEAFDCNGTQEVKVLAEKPPFAYDNTFRNYNIPLYVPKESINDYQSTNPWSKFSSLKTLSGEDADMKCKTPTISYTKGRLTFSCETEGVEYKTSITDTDIKDYTGSSIQLSVTYTVKVYATKSSYQNSDVATATLCWIDVDPKTEGITTGTSHIPAKAVLIQSQGGMLTVQGADDGTKIGVYNINGTLACEGISRNGCATVNTNLQPGSVAIIKIGDRSVKVVVK